MDDQVREACGVFGVYAPGRPVAHLTYLGLYALQHRGQESAGIAASDGEMITVIKDMGLVSQVFNELKLAPLDGHLAMGHVRYSTTGSSTWRNAQPVYRSVGDAGIALGHNGNLTNTVELAESLGMLPGVLTSDSELVGELLGRAYEDIERSDGRELEHALQVVLPKLAGAFSLVLMDEAHLFGVRDPHGFRPLVLGRTEGGWVLASETAALDIVGAHFVREVEPGELVAIDANGVRSIRYAEPTPKLCLFEFVYIARPDTQLYGQSVHSARQRMGEELARQAPVDGDMVMPVPESGVPAAQGYARQSGIPYGDGFVKNRYVGRTFIDPRAHARGASVRIKLNPLPSNVKGKRVIVVDDSIVRGTTTRETIALLREAGATEVHFRVSSPPYKWPCFYGLDTGKRSDLLAADMSVGEIKDFLGVDSLGYLELDRLIAATGAGAEGFCTACFTGDYPVPVPESDMKLVLEDERVLHLPSVEPV
ncbi:MAG TPA: amidophosphoribosyltransferase [Acidimicrobiia bacterium]|jgi:amidophosphoribosyltransferase|nr:amidophosphoribosyltransferase [Acidimicrobiia bacterium]